MVLLALGCAYGRRSRPGRGHGPVLRRQDGRYRGWGQHDSALPNQWILRDANGLLKGWEQQTPFGDAIRRFR